MFNNDDLYGPVSFGGGGAAGGGGGGGGWRADSCNTPRGLAAGGTIASAFDVNCNGSAWDDVGLAIGLVSAVPAIATLSVGASIFSAGSIASSLGSAYAQENWDK